MDSTEPQKFGQALFWRLLLAGYWITLVVGTHLPPTFPALTEQLSDKFEHFFAYGILAWLLAMAWQTSTGRLNRRHLLLVWLAVILAGMLDEVTQTLFGRDASVWDWLADAAGAALGLVMFTLTRSLVRASEFRKNQAVEDCEE